MPLKWYSDEDGKPKRFLSFKNNTYAFCHGRKIEKVIVFGLSSFLYKIHYPSSNYWHGMSDQLLLRLHNNLRNIPSLVMYYLTKFDCVIQRGF